MKCSYSTDPQTGHYHMLGHLKHPGMEQEADLATKEVFFLLLIISGFTL